MSKDKYKISNWQQYSEGLKQRGSIQFWINDEVLNNWGYAGKAKRGGQRKYGDIAIELCLVIRKVYHLGLRQTQGFMRSFFAMSGLRVEVPDYSTLSRRSKGLGVTLSTVKNKVVTDIAVDSTGLKVYGEGEWKVRKHGAGKHRTWMKLHIACEISTQQIEAVTLSTNSIDDASEAQALLGQIKEPVNSFRGDGAYDKVKVRKVLFEKNIKQIIPPQHNAVKSNKKVDYLQQRDEDISLIEAQGREEWKKQKGYHQRSKSETVMYRYKTIIGDRLAARKIENQVTEVKIGCQILNKALQAAKPVSYKVTW